MKTIREFLNTTTGISIEVLDKILISLAIILLLWLFKLAILRVVWRQTKDIKTRYQWKRSLSLITPFISVILVGSIWAQAFRQFGAFLGLFSAGLAIALKDPLTNLAGWFFIVFRKPFIVGDRIQIGNHAGDVIDIRLFQFTILEIGNWVDADQSTGRIIHLPNAKVFQTAQANYSTGFEYIWNEISIMITFESNWQKTKNLLQQIANKFAEHIGKEAEKEIFNASRSYMIYYKHLTPIVYTKVKEFGIQLSIRYMCNPRQRRSTEDEIWQEILIRLKSEKDIQFAYPTTRFYTFGEEQN